VASELDKDLVLRQRLREVGQRREQAERVVRAATDELAPLVVEARGLGISITEIAKDTGLSRPTIYDLLRRAG
jgi:DNA-directed RNA polymerase specialized sigma24 family protein